MEETKAHISTDAGKAKSILPTRSFGCKLISHSLYLGCKVSAGSTKAPLLYVIRIINKLNVGNSGQQGQRTRVGAVRLMDSCNGQGQVVS
ncbi:hypothetical protein L1987_64649 [Smallanthus sonchifolius]|uniref:Uncharacterized protein n=1 Tax=Smallanthus sonchifolius TaxID=185202 RepID=A0ACB9BSA9_9ASTR|nr:hypothetical protein L1987_64649 [Smallanthus sonchifolius]